MPKIYIIDESASLIVGKSAIENTELVKSAHPDEWWFHFENTSSASAILKTTDFKKRYLDIASQLLVDHHHKGPQKVMYRQVKNLIVCSTPGLFIPKF
jgi:predicted ribosome quality control (RQC) complex YloA/Tae2 family protein